MFNIFRKEQEKISRITPGFEEAERKTPFAGIILLIAMFAAGLFFGWRAMDDLGRIPKQPAPISTCGYRYGESVVLFESLARPYEPPLLYFEDYSRCDFGELENKYNIPQIFEPRRPLEEELRPILQDLNQINDSLYELRARLGQATQEYGIGLEEKQAQIKKPLFPTETVLKSVPELRQEISKLEARKDGLESKRSNIEDRIKVIDGKLKEAYRPVFKEQNQLLRRYEFKVFLLQFVFIIPFFWLVFWGYLRLHRKSSPYTVIFTAMVAVASILLFKVLLTWFWGLFLARVLEVVLAWIRNFQILRTIVFYLGMILSFLIFGGAVWWLQRKIFDPRRVILRRFRNKQCPHCQTNLDLSIFYCPNCGAQIKAKCDKCGQARFAGLPNCPNCGDKKEM